MNLTFKIISAKTSEYPRLPHTVYLRRDNWDDKLQYQTQFFLSAIDSSGVEHDIGNVKIGQRALRAGKQIAPSARAPELNETFQVLNSNFFSLGQDESYYEALDLLGEEVRIAILKALRDCAFDSLIYEEFCNEPVMSVSLMRDFTKNRVQHRLARLAHGNPALTAFEFTYQPPIPKEEVIEWNRPLLSFSVKPLSTPPTNIHVVIGRNGVGKTKLLQNMACAILKDRGDDETYGTLRSIGQNRDGWSFAGLIFMSFSVFDTFKLPRSIDPNRKAHQVHLRDSAATDDLSTHSELLAEDFLTAFGRCVKGPRRNRWRRAIKTLTTDPLFDDVGIEPLADLAAEESQVHAYRIFKSLSSGHKIVILAICKLVDLVEEATLVLIDEPETHLHPPLLSAFIRALADLLLDRNGVAIIATHSPVVLQEVPASCVWVFTRSGPHSNANRPGIETFGENVGTLTHEIFKLEVTDSGFHNLLKLEVNNKEFLSFDAIIEKFGSQLGGEARAILRGLIRARDSKGES